MGRRSETKPSEGRDRRAEDAAQGDLGPRGRPGARWLVVLRYALFQVPELALVAVVLVFLQDAGWIEPVTAALLLAVWLGKDVALFPFVRQAYAPHDGRLPRDPRGQIAIASEAFEREGYVRLGPERWRARRAEDSPAIASGAAVRVLSLDGLTLIVEPCAEAGDIARGAGKAVP